ncbi:hypothetical protein KGF56_002326 [Candida oxycetoniae]|uniref:BHLH domain-containing protein n=1 Tax=Candida oxycetoniae TaxID=497107 RepID=A0AAI9WYJ9_9ASCO|nr:uncharacterized protein KGF56_002326 [Candida oxycetoniae]KAI3404910.2 hypothetical protein KGF56_002326 [Candida oxycetoniae]
MSFRLSEYNTFIPAEDMQSEPLCLLGQGDASSARRVPTESSSFPVDIDFGLSEYMSNGRGRGTPEGGTEYLDAEYVNYEQELAGQMAQQMTGQVQGQVQGQVHPMPQQIPIPCRDTALSTVPVLGSPLSMETPYPQVFQDSSSPSTPSSTSKDRQRPSLYTRSTSSLPTSGVSARPGRPRVKSAHNVIEQRYRNKINDKFNALQESVPTLKVLSMKKHEERMRSEDDSDEEDEELSSAIDIDLEGLEPARKLNKGTILAKSIEYIKFLESKNDRMKQDQQDLLRRAKSMGIPLNSLQ